MAQPIFTATFLDRSGEKSTMQVPLPTIGAGNIVAALDSITDGTPDGLLTTLKALSHCTLVRSQVALDPEFYVENLPASALAQREMALLVSYQDNVNGKKYTFSIPGPKWDLIGQAGTDIIDPANVLWLAAKTAIQTFMVSPDGNAITVVAGRLVGRNR